jgi:CMP-N-acetylneuraminic acid synthetase
MTGRRILPLVMDEIESVDIDTYHDFMVAEALLAERPDHFTRP